MPKGQNNPKNKVEKSAPYKGNLRSALENAQYAAGYLSGILKCDDLDIFHAALRDVARARGGESEFLRDFLTDEEELSFETVWRVLKETGLQLCIRPITPDPFREKDGDD